MRLVNEDADNEEMMEDGGSSREESIGVLTSEAASILVRAASGHSRVDPNVVQALVSACERLGIENNDITDTAKRYPVNKYAVA